MLTILEKVFLQLRSKTGRGPLTAEESAQIAALADALHNAPSSLRNHDGLADEKSIHAALVHYSELARERRWTLLRTTCVAPPPSPPRPGLRLVKR